MNTLQIIEKLNKDANRTVALMVKSKIGEYKSRERKLLLQYCYFHCSGSGLNFTEYRED